jgi:hypothetical protein
MNKGVVCREFPQKNLVRKFQPLAASKIYFLPTILLANHQIKCNLYDVTKAENTFTQLKRKVIIQETGVND